MYSYRAFRFGMVLVFAIGCKWLGSLPSSQAPLPKPSFATPPFSSIAGSEVGLTGMFAMAKGDFNGDGIPDIAIAGFACANGSGLPANSIAVYLGKGDGTFKPPVYYPCGPCPHQVVVGPT